MPVSLEQWRASVGANNSAHSHMLKKYWGGKRAPKNLLDHLILCLMSLFTLGAVTTEVEALSRSSSVPVGKQSTDHTHEGGGYGWRWLCAITVVMILLWCSGDVELNPGPLSGPFDLTSDNLADVRDLTFGARLQWLDLGLELGLNVTALHVIQKNNSNDVEACFRDMLLEWLRKTSPPPTWEALIAALEKDCIRYPEVTKKVKKACGLDLEDKKPLTTPAVMPTGGLLADKIVRMEQEFEHLVDATEESFIENQVPLKRIQKSIKHIPVSLKRDLGGYFQDEAIKILKLESIEEVFIFLSYYWDYLNPGLLEFLVGRFGADTDVELLHKYLGKLEQFQADVKLVEYVLQVKQDEISESRYRRITAIMGSGWEQKTLQDAVKYKNELAKELNIQLFLVRNRPSASSIAITICLPPWIEVKVEELEPFFKATEVIKVYVDGVCHIDWTEQVSSPSIVVETEDNLPTQGPFKKFAVCLDLKWKDQSLQDLSEHVIHKFNLPSFKEILPEKLHTTITWSLPDDLASRVRSDIENTDMTSFYKEHGILSISIDGEECKYNAIRHYSTYLKELYSQKKYKNLAPFKLARIWRREVKRIELDKLSKSTLRGDQDDLVYRKRHIKEEEICCPTCWTEDKQPRLVLIEGAPGVGKTTFSELFCYKWSQGQRLSNNRLLVLLPLRDNRVRSAKNVSDLFQHPQLQHTIVQEVEKSGGEGVALWLEAWDELEEEMREKSSLFLELVHGRLLPNATVLVTSRPWASHNIRKEANQHVEIVSTPSIQFSRVLREGRVKPDSREKFLDYVDFNPYMKAAMHTPVTANIVTDVFQWSRGTESPPPTTMTQLYTALTCKLLMKHLSRNKADGKQPLKIQSLEEVPADLKKQLLNLCRLSWEGLVRQQLTFSNDAVGGDTLGLMHAVPELYGGEDGQLSYHFIHLTLQEFLSAFHISQLPPDTQWQVIQQHASTGHLTMAVRFFFGLTEPNIFTSSLISQYITSQLRRVSASVYHWLYEAGDVGKLTEGLEAGKEVCVRSSYTWNPLDYYVVGHVFSQCNFRWKLNFSGTSMGDEEMEMYCKGMRSSTETTCEEISVLDFYNNNISVEGIKWLQHIPLATHVKKLRLGANKLDRNALIALSEAVPKLTGLQGLSLWRNPIGEGGAMELLRYLQHYKTPLKTLNLQSTCIVEKDVASLTLLIQNNKLEKLDMCYNNIRDAGAAAIGGTLKYNTALRELQIRLCCITAAGCVQLAAGLTENTTLCVLDMGGNAVGAEGAKALGKMLQQNDTLQDLHLSGDKSMGEGVAVLISSLDMNKTLLELTLSDEYQRPSDPRVRWW